MKRTISTIVLFVLLILTVVALTKLDTPTTTSARTMDKVAVGHAAN